MSNGRAPTLIDVAAHLVSEVFCLEQGIVCGKIRQKLASKLTVRLSSCG
jgi:hypothetical protein